MSLVVNTGHGLEPAGVDMCSPHMAWASSQHGSWSLRASGRESHVEAVSSFMTLSWKSHSVTSATLCSLKQSQKAS